MEFYLNSEQSKGLASFFFDTAKGLVLGGIALSVTVPWETRIVAVLGSLFFAIWCVKMALDLLKEVK